MLKSVLFLSVLFLSTTAFSQNETQSGTGKTYNRSDSVYLAKLNTSGNLMIAGGVGLCGAGSYLIWQGTRVYQSIPASTPGTAVYAEEKQRNERQGIIYLAAGGVGIAGGIVLTAFGAKNKVEFKNRKKMMEMQGGILDNGSLGLALKF